MSTPRRSPALALAGALLVAASLGGCSGGEPSSAPTPEATASASTGGPTTATRSAEPSSTAPTTTPVPSKPKPPKRPKNTTKGRAAFARYVVAAWSYAVATNDPKPLLKLSPKGQPCAGCDELAAELKQREKQGWRVAIEPITPTKVALAGKRPGPQPVLVATIDIPESDAVNDDGSLRGVSPAHTGASFRVRMAPVRKGFDLLGFSVQA